MGQAAWPGDHIGDACCGNVVATTGLQDVYRGVRDGTVEYVEYCNNMIKGTNHTRKKKINYLIGISNKGVGLVGSSADVCSSLCGIYASKQQACRVVQAAGWQL